jgi:hypothetical protein
MNCDLCMNPCKFLHCQSWWMTSSMHLHASYVMSSAVLSWSVLFRAYTGVCVHTLEQVLEIHMNQKKLVHVHDDTLFLSMCSSMITILSGIWKLRSRSLYRYGSAILSMQKVRSPFCLQRVTCTLPILLIVSFSSLVLGMSVLFNLVNL